MNKSELIDTLSGRLGGKAVASTAVEHVIDTITRAVAKGEKVTITGFGVFEKADRAARTGRNPATGAVVRIKKTSVPKFRPGAEFKAYVSGAKKLAKATATAAPATKKAAASTLAKKSGSPAKKSAAAKKLAKAPARKAAAARVPATKKAAAKTLAKKSGSPAKKSAAAKKLAKAPAKKAAAKTTAKKSPAKKTTARKAPAKKSTARKAPAKRGAR